MPVQPGKPVHAILVNIVKISRKSNENGMAIFLNINRVEIFFFITWGGDNGGGEKVFDLEG